MKYLDTNVIVRAITGDDQTLATKALTEIQSGKRHEFCIVDAVLVEACFVLEFHDYAMKREDIVAALEVLVNTPQVFVSGPTRQALQLYKQYPKLDYVDCLLFVLGGKTGVMTFDNDSQTNLLK